MDQGNQYEVPPVGKSCARETQEDSPTVSAYRVVQPLGFFGPDQKGFLPLRQSRPNRRTLQVCIVMRLTSPLAALPASWAIYSYSFPGPQMS